MIGYPLETRGGEHQVVIAVRGPRRDVTGLERHAGAGMFAGRGEHVRRIVDAGDVTDRELPGRQRRQLAGTATEVDRPTDRIRSELRQQIVKRLRALGGEPTVLLRVPCLRP